MAEIIHSWKRQAPLPLTTTYTPERDSEVVLMFSGSAWTSKTNCIIGLILEIDGEDVCTAEIWSNGPTTHRLLMPGIVSYRFKLKISNDSPPTPVNIRVKALNADTNFDVNDYASLTIL